QFLISNFVGPYLTDILASLAAIGALVVLLHFWKPAGAADRTGHRHSAGEVALAWAPYGLLVVFVLAWGNNSVKAILNQATVNIPWPGLHNQVLRVAPVTPATSPYPAIYTLNLLSAAGTSCLFAALASAAVLRLSLGRLVGLIGAVAKQLVAPMVTILS